MALSYCISMFLLLLTHFLIIAKRNPPVEFIENVEALELMTTFDDKLRNVLTEFHQVTDEDVNFYLTTREIRNLTKLNDTNLNLVNNRKLTKIIVGGWLQYYRISAVYVDMAKAYLSKGDYNVVLVDFHTLMYYPVDVASSYLAQIGIKIGRFVVKLNQTVNLPLNYVHIISHSLGGNAAGPAGREIIKLTGSQIYRITGLDSSKIPFKGLDKGDAVIVDMIHTTATIAVAEPIGTIDFYPNGGNYDIQPGCSLYPQSPFQNLWDALDFIFCSHHKSYEYFIQTMNLTIYAVQCPSFTQFQEGKCKNNELAIFGDNYEPGPNGTFYLYLNCTDSNCVSSYN